MWWVVRACHDQMSEVETLKQDLESFFLSVREYRNAFRREAPFTFTGPVTQAYQEMDKQVRASLNEHHRPSTTLHSQPAVSPYMTRECVLWVVGGGQVGLLYELEKQVVKYNELEELFELQVSEHTQTTHSLTHPRHACSH